MLIEISHRIESGLRTYPGLPAPQAETLTDFEASRRHYGNLAEFRICSIALCGNTGTYVDAPLHRYRQGADLARLPLERLADLPVSIIDVTGLRGAMEAAHLRDVPLEGRAVLVRTGFSRHFGTEEYSRNHPFLSGAACDLLVEAGAAFVGMDTLNVDDLQDLSRPAHTKLLGAGIPICEHMTNLAAVPASDGRLHAVPIAWVGGTSFPVRAYVVTS
jgi:kynurenine formamidase